MDEVKIHTKFTKDIIAKIIKSTLFKKTVCIDNAPAAEIVCFGIVAVLAVVRTTLYKYREAYPRTVNKGLLNDSRNSYFHLYLIQLFFARRNLSNRTSSS